MGWDVKGEERRGGCGVVSWLSRIGERRAGVGCRDA